MPLLKFHVVNDSYSAAEHSEMLDAVHEAMVASFGVPPRDRYQILTSHAPGHLKALDTGLGFDRTERFVLIEIVSRQRTKEQKATFYRSVLAVLSSTLGLAATDLMMTFQINGDEDWSFGSGEAQFLTGDLR